MGRPSHPRSINGAFRHRCRHIGGRMEPVGVRPGAVQSNGLTGSAHPPFTGADERSRRLRFVAVGIWNTGFAYGAWATLQILLGDRLHYLAILILVWPIAVLNAYACHRRFVFRSSGVVRKELPRFSLVYVATLAASLILLPILLGLLPFNIYVIQGAFTVVVVALSYLAHRSFSFGPGGGRRSATSGGRG